MLQIRGLCLANEKLKANKNKLNLDRKDLCVA